MDSKNTSTIVIVILGISITYLLYRELRKPRRPTVIYVPSKPQIVTQYVPEYIPDFNYDRRHHHRNNRDIIINNNNDNENIIHNRVLPINNIPLRPQIPRNPLVGTINHNHPSF